MAVIIHIISVSAALFVCALAAFLLLEVAASLASARFNKFKELTPGTISVVIPAHNEATIIASTLTNVKAQLRESDRLIVVADNCSDETANVAKAHGAECFIRNDIECRGKGFALQFAIDNLRRNPPDIVIFLDADCLFADGALSLIARTAAGEDRPVQALYLMRAPEKAAAHQRVAEFAWLFINQVRMRGLQNLFNVTRFTGAGFAMPWAAISKVDVGSGQIVEDLALTFELINQGDPPLLQPEALVTSEFPEHKDAQMKQAARWSIGSLTYTSRHGVAWMMRGFSKGQLQLAAAAIDLMIPPLTIFLLYILVAMVLSAVSWIFGSVTAMVLTGLAMMQTAVAISLGWTNYGRAVLPASDLVAVGRFVGAKFLVFGAKGRATAKTWTPTRGGDHSDHTE